MTKCIVEDFVDSAIERLRLAGLMRRPDPRMPPEMRDARIIRSNDWIGWKPIPSSATDADLDDLERTVTLKFPPLYRELLRYQHFYELGGSLRWQRHLPGRWKTDLQAKYVDMNIPERIIGVGLLPFADEALMDAGPVCFDTRQRLPNGDCPIVFWDHEWVKTDKEINPLFSCMERMLHCLTFEARSEIGFMHHDDDDDAELLATKLELMKQFLAFDPEGAGGPAREYWTAFGVDPARS